jgi:catechol 2,3-dioxygenase-like lactoylglutathione lyase family enzyme
VIVEHVAIAVSDLERSVEFYGDVFGFRVLRMTPTNAFLYLDGNLLELIEGDLQSDPGPSATEEWQNQRVSRFGLSHIGFRVDRIDTALDEVQRRGGSSVVVPPYEFEPEIGFVEHTEDERLAPASRPRPGSRWKLAVVADPDGTLLELIER